MSVGALSLTAYIATLGKLVADDNWQQSVNTETAVIVNYQQIHIPFRHKNWQLLESSICANQKQQITDFSQCTQHAKSLFTQICTALTNQPNDAEGHRQYQQMYCRAAVNFQPKIITISYGENATMSEQERVCNRLILKVMVEPSKTLIAERNKACKGIK